jgi:ABC-type Fe3+/spermidine/putrescine transport system ATPase subunit
LFPLDSGVVYFRGEDIGPLPTHKRLQAGIGRTFQNIRLFGQLTVWQNLWVAQNSPEDRASRSFFSRWLGGPVGGARRDRPAARVQRPRPQAGGARDEPRFRRAAQARARARARGEAEAACCSTSRRPE